MTSCVAKMLVLVASTNLHNRKSNPIFERAQTADSLLHSCVAVLLTAPSPIAINQGSPSPLSCELRLGIPGACSCTMRLSFVAAASSSQGCRSDDACLFRVVCDSSNSLIFHMDLDLTLLFLCRFMNSYSITESRLVSQQLVPGDEQQQP